MQAKRPSERGPSWPVLWRILFLCFLLGTLLSEAIGEAFAEATLTVKLPKLPRNVKAVSISVRAVEAETSRLLGSVYLNKTSSQVQMKVEAVPLIVFGEMLTSQGSRLNATATCFGLLIVRNYP